jgi:hypothetical protein
MQTSNNDRFGFYTVGDFKTYSKLEAIEHSGVTHQPVKWDFNNEKFRRFNWFKEPPGSLEFWYGERARQIRDKYDYIVLWYSGGADSHNALMSFIKNNIYIDEIAQFHNLSGEKGNKESFLNEEVFTTSAPVTQDLITNNPTYRNTKHRLVDLSELQMNVLTKDNNQWDYFYKVGTYLSPNALARSYLRETISDYRVLIEQGKSVCFIYGAEKPHIEEHNGKWYTVFRDCLDYAVSPRTQLLKRDWEHNEMFYWSDDLPQLLAKQAHVIQRYLSGITPELVDNIHVSLIKPNYFPIASVTINQLRYHLLNNGLHRLIYPDWNPESIVCGKPASLAYSARDFWMFNSSAPDIGQQYYTQGLKKMKQIVTNADPKYWFEFDSVPGTPYKGGMETITNSYRFV